MKFIQFFIKRLFSNERYTNMVRDIEFINLYFVPELLTAHAINDESTTINKDVKKNPRVSFSCDKMYPFGKYEAGWLNSYKVELL